MENFLTVSVSSGYNLVSKGSLHHENGNRFFRFRGSGLCAHATLIRTRKPTNTTKIYL
jgi:hypothetical protein